MQKMKMVNQKSLTFQQGCELYLNNCRQRNLRDGTLKHYKSSYIQLYKYIPYNIKLTDVTEECTSPVKTDNRKKEPPVVELKKLP